MKATKINYDPHHIISQRRQHNKKKEFDHWEIEGLAGKANLMEYQSNTKNYESLQANTSATMNSIAMIWPNPSKIETIGKRSLSEIVEEEVS